MSTDAVPSAVDQVEVPGTELPTERVPLEQLVRRLLAREAEHAACQAGHQMREAQLLAALNASTQTVEQQRELLDKLTHELALMKRWVFGSRRERFGADDPRQKSLFEVSQQAVADLAAADDESSEVDPDAESGDDRKKKKKRRGHGRQPLPQFLPRQRVEYIVDGTELGCPGCGQDRAKISEVISEQLEYTPASLFVVEHVQITYACQPCQEHVVTADKPPQPIEKGIPGPGLLARTSLPGQISGGWHLPLYRQEEESGPPWQRVDSPQHAVWLDVRRGPSVSCRCRRTDDKPLGCWPATVLGTDDTPVKVLDPRTGPHFGPPADVLGVRRRRATSRRGV